MNDETAGTYLRENFEPQDRLAVVLLNKRTGSFLQRLADRDTITGEEFQNWLQRYNDDGYEIYVSMNALQPQAAGRCKKDVAVIRHVFLDFDEKGTEAVNALVSRPDIPNPNYLLSSSPGKWQVVWKVQGFGKDEAEQLQRALARDTGADPAATDCARVLRLPGFHNHKYDTPHQVTVTFRTEKVYGAENFPTFGHEDPVRHLTGKQCSVSPLHLSQSERDWAYAKRALARGDSQNGVVAAIETFRQYDKPNPRYYAEITVRKAAAALQAETAERGPARG